MPVARWVLSSAPSGPPAAGALSVLDDDLSEQAVGFTIGPGGEDQFAGLGGVPVAESQAPEPIDDDRLAVRPPQLAQVRARHGVVDVDVAVTEVPHEQVSAELAESGWRRGQAPRRVERAPGDKPADERAVVGEDGPESVAPPRGLLVQRG